MRWHYIRSILHDLKQRHLAGRHQFAMRSRDHTMHFRLSIGRFLQRSFGAPAISHLYRKARWPLLILTGFFLATAVAFVPAILFPVVHLQKSASVNFRQGITPTLEPNTAESPSALATHRMTTLGRLKLDKELIKRLSNNLTLAEAKNYVRGRLLLFEGLAAQMDADAALFDQEFAKKSCATAAELRLASTMWELSSFQNSHVNRVMHLNPATPVGGMLFNDDATNAEAIQKLQLRILFRVSDAALKANCFDLAQALYRKVVPVAATVQDMQRAQVGIQSAQQRKLQGR